MRKALFLFMLMFTCHGFADEIHQSEQAKKAQLINVVLSVPLSDLVIESDQIHVNYEGHLYTVKSLEKSGENWAVTAYYAWCPNGHEGECIKCGGCYGPPSCPFRCRCRK